MHALLRPAAVILALSLCSPAAAQPGASSEMDMLEGREEAPKGPEPEAQAAVEPATPAEPPIDGAAARAQALVAGALENVVNLQVEFGSWTPGGAREAATAEAVEARQALQQALVELGRLQERGDLRRWVLQREPERPAVAPSDDGEPLSQQAFEALISAMEAVSFTRERMQIMVRDLDRGRLTTGQASRLVDLFSFSSDRVDALVFLHPRVTDPEGFDRLLAALKFDSDRQIVRGQLGLED